MPRLTEDEMEIKRQHIAVIRAKYPNATNKEVGEHLLKLYGESIAPNTLTKLCNEDLTPESKNINVDNEPEVLEMTRMIVDLQNQYNTTTDTNEKIKLSNAVSDLYKTRVDLRTKIITEKARTRKIVAPVYNIEFGGITSIDTELEFFKKVFPSEYSEVVRIKETLGRTNDFAKLKIIYSARVSKNGGKPLMYLEV